MWRGAAVYLLAIGLGLAACASASTGRTLDADEGRFRVPIPDGWQARATNPADWADHATVALLATQPLDPQCGTASASGAGCTAPVAELADGSVLIWWRSANCAGAGCELPDGERLLVGGRQAVRTNGTHLCDTLGATREDVVLVTVTPQRVDALVVCERNAAPDVHQQVDQLMEEVDWRTP